MVERPPDTGLCLGRGHTCRPAGPEHCPGRARRWASGRAGLVPHQGLRAEGMSLPRGLQPLCVCRHSGEAVPPHWRTPCPTGARERLCTERAAPAPPSTNTRTLDVARGKPSGPSGCPPPSLAARPAPGALVMGEEATHLREGPDNLERDGLGPLGLALSAPGTPVPCSPAASGALESSNDFATSCPGSLGPLCVCVRRGRGFSFTFHSMASGNREISKRCVQKVHSSLPRHRSQGRSGTWSHRLSPRDPSCKSDLVSHQR